MTDTPNRQSVIVGLFVLIALLLFAGGILTVGRINAAFTRTIAVSTVFDDAGGLQPGDKVWFAGLEVGKVHDLGFDAGGVKVDLAIARDDAVHIPANALAKIGSDGLIGNKLVVLYDGTSDAGPLADGQSIPAGDTVTTEEMLAMFQENNANVLAITNDLKAVTARLANGEGSAGKLLADDALYERIDATVASLQGASGHAEQLTRSLSTFAGDLNREGTLPHELVTDEELYASVASSIQDLETTADRASKLVAGLEQATSDPNTAMGALLRDHEAGGDVKETLSNLNESTRLLSQDLEAVQHNFLLRGFFKKKEKERAEAAPVAPKPSPRQPEEPAEETEPEHPAPPPPSSAK